MSKARILISMPGVNHVEIAWDEIEGLRRLGYTCESFSFAAKDGYKSILSRLWIIVKNAFLLVKTARKFNPDIIYFNSRLEKIAGYRDFITIAIFNTLYRKNVKFVIKSHGSDLEVLDVKESLFGKIVLPYLKNNISGWLFLSSEEGDYVIQPGKLPANKVFITKNIVRAGQFKIDAAFKKTHDIPEDHKVLLFVGRLIRQKGIYEVVEAIQNIKHLFKVTLIIVGEGAELAQVQHKVEKLSLSGNVIFTGHIPEKEVIHYYSNSDILVFPTFFPEGFPMALFNSVAAGIAIITTPVRAAVDYLSEPENCLWVEPQNTDSVTERLTTLLRDESLLILMKSNNQKKGTVFSVERVCTELSLSIDSIFQ